MAFNPLESLSDSALWDTQLLLHLTCGRGKQPLRSKRRKFLCQLAQLVEQEFTRRSLPSPQPPYHVGQLRA